jgi:hypothetical protein
VWEALLRTHDTDAHDAVVEADSPFADEPVHRTVLRLHVPPQALLLRVAAHAQEAEFARVVRRALWLAPRSARHALDLLRRLEGAWPAQIAAAPPPLWRDLLASADAGLRERSLVLVARSRGACTAARRTAIGGTSGRTAARRRVLGRSMTRGTLPRAAFQLRRLMPRSWSRPLAAIARTVPATLSPGSETKYQQAHARRVVPMSLTPVGHPSCPRRSTS